jgi:NADPH:quinone reductase-like Zn-dependent oxidoreductase
MRLIPLLLAAVAFAGSAAADTIKAVRIHAYGGVEALTLDAIEKPTPGKGEVLVKTFAAGVNPVDWKIRDGMMGPRLKLPFTLGHDISGEVEAVGEGVTEFKPGDEVFAYLALQRGGGYAQYAAVPVKELAKKPKSIDHVYAAAVPLAALTAWQALFDKADLQPGQTVLIHAGAGGVGHFAIQLAKWKGAKVIATASARNHDFLRELGADVCVDYTKERFEDVAKNVDVVLDPIGGETQDRSLATLKDGGILVSIVQPPNPAKLKDRNLRGLVMLVQPNGAQLAKLAELVDSGKLKPHVSDTLPLGEVAKAHELSAAGRTRGKIVLKVR